MHWKKRTRDFQQTDAPERSVDFFATKCRLSGRCRYVGNSGGITSSSTNWGISLLIALALIGPTSSRLAAAKYAGESFTLGAQARPMGMGGAYVALANDPSGLYYNPAGIAQLATQQVTLLHSATFGSLVNHDFIGYTRPIHLGSRSGSGGLALYRVGGGGIVLTERDPITGGPRVISEEGHYDYMAIVGAGLRWSERFRLGATAKVIIRSLAGNSAWGLGVDAGFQYGLAETMAFGASITNLTSTFLAYDNGTTESILPAVRFGGSSLLRADQFSIRVLADADLLFEGRDQSAQISVGGMSLDSHFGAEIGYQNLIFFRGGSDIDRLTLGVGVNYQRLRLDGAFMNHNDLDNSYRISLNIAL